MPESVNDERTQAVIALVRFSFPVDELRSMLTTFPWDFETPLAVLEPADIQRHSNSIAGSRRPQQHREPAPA